MPLSHCDTWIVDRQWAYSVQRVPDCLGGLSRVGISSRSTRPWNGQPPSYRDDSATGSESHIAEESAATIIAISTVYRSVYRQTNRHIDRQTEIQTNGHTYRQAGRQTHIQTNGHTYRQAGRQTDRQRYRQTGIHTGRQTDRQRYRQTGIHAYRQAGRQTSDIHAYNI